MATPALLSLTYEKFMRKIFLIGSNSQLALPQPKFAVVLWYDAVVVVIVSDVVGVCRQAGFCMITFVLV